MNQSFRRDLKLYLCFRKTIHMNFRHVIQKIRKELEKPLPGKKHQFLMAPAIRRFPENEIAEKKAAVLVCLFKGRNDLQVALIKRTEYDGPHSGQISFPGGIYKNTDTSLEETALREAEEEIGIGREHAKVLGALSPLHIPVSNIIVYPYVAFYEHEPVFRVDEKEVSYMIIAGLKSFIDPENRKKEKWVLSGQEIEVPFFQLDSNKIWGATAMMLCEFITIAAKAGIYPCKDKR
jgi:8-oxo-dGTP pyrophosphatase MutT (NUDIX family)